MDYIQNNFSAGEFSPLLSDRSDFDRYKNSLKKLENAFPIAQGGITNAFSLDYMQKLSYGYTRIVTVKMQEKVVIFAFVQNSIHIYIETNGVINNTPDHQVATNYSLEDIKNMRHAQDHNEIIFLDGKHPILLIGYENGSFLSTNMVIKNPPTNDFLRNYDDVVFLFKTTSGKFEDDKNKQVGAIFTVELDNQPHSKQAEILTSYHKNGTLYANLGFFRITEYQDDGSRIWLTIQANTPFGFPPTPIGKAGTNGTIPGYKVILKEPTFSSIRGYPYCAAFFFNRLFLAATTSVPNGIWGSQIGNYIDFDIGTGEDNDAISIEISATKTPKIYDIVGLRSLIFLTSEGIFSTSIFTMDNVVAPRNMTTSLVTNHQSSQTILPVVLDNQVFFANNTNDKIFVLAYDIKENGYAEKDVSLLNPSMTEGLVHMHGCQNPNNLSGDYLFSLKNDGSLGVFISLQEQEIYGWANIKLSVDSVSTISGLTDSMYCYINNSIMTKLNMHADKNLYCLYKQHSDVPTTIFSGIPNIYDQRDISLYADGLFISKGYILDGSTLTLDKAASDIIIGISLSSKIILQNISLQHQSDFSKKSITQVGVNVQNSGCLKMNDIQLGLFQLDKDKTDEPLEINELHTWHVPYGWTINTDIELSNVSADPFLIKSVYRRIANDK